MKRLALVLLLAPALASAEVGGLVAAPSITLGANLVSNGDAEAGAKTGWTDAQSCFTAATDQKHAGTYSFKAVDLNACSFTNALIQNLSFTAGYSYRLTGWIKTDALGTASPTAGVRVYLRTTGTGNCGQGCGGTTVYTGTRDWTYFEIKTIPITGTVTGSIRVEEYGSVAGTVWVDDLSVVREVPPPIEAKLLLPAYRGILWSDMTQEAQFRLTNNDGGQMESVVTYDADPGNPVVANRSAGVVTIALTGTATVAFRIQGSATPDYPQYRIITHAASERTTWPLSWTGDGRFRVNDTPTFLIGVYDSGLGYSSVESGYETPFGTYRRLNEIGGDADSYLNYWYGGVTPSNMSAGIDWLQTHNFKLYWQTANCFGSGAWDANYFATFGTPGYIAALAADQGVAGWYVMDECIDATAATMFTDLKTLRDTAPKTANLAVTNLPDTIGKWYESVDILAADPYALYGAEPAGGYPLAMVGDWTRKVTAAAEYRPTMEVIQFFKFTGLGRWPTEAELRSMSYMAVVDGAQGLWYWSLGVNALAYADGCGSTEWCAAKVDYYGRLKNVLAEMRANEAIFLAADVPANLASVNDSNIRTRTKATHVMAYNAVNTATNSTFTWHAPVASVTVVGESRTITPVGYTWTDSFAGFGAHVYQITDGEAAPATLEYQQPIVGPTTVSVAYGHSTLTEGVACSATLKTLAGATVSAVNDSTGGTQRTALWSGLTAATQYTITFSCTGFTDALYGVTTAAAPVVVARGMSIALSPGTRLATAAKAKVEYGLASGAVTDNSTTADCAAGCTVTLSNLDAGAQYQVRHSWLTSGDATIVTSRIRLVRTP